MPTGDEEAVDETDPLFQAVLKVTSGDRERALKMLEDPDSLLQYPEVRTIMEQDDAAAEGEDTKQEEVPAERAGDWEAMADRKAECEGVEEKGLDGGAASPVPAKAEAEGEGEEEAPPAEDVASLGMCMIWVWDIGMGMLV
ncbi:hypothetical protein EON64_14060 [archaeon]|nr:MAG: hypothetical protein EON64_14060 [archaeon]